MEVKRSTRRDKNTAFKTFVPGFDVNRQILSGPSREARPAVTVLPSNRDGEPELPQRPGVQDPPEGDQQVQL